MKRIILSVFLLIACNTMLPAQAPSKGPTSYIVAEQMPEFPGGQSEMIQFISKELNYPASPAHDSLSNGSYKVFVRFVVDTSGRVVEPTVVKAFPECPECEKEALRVMRKMPVWRPGMQQGKKVNVTFTIPITFTSH